MHKQDGVPKSYRTIAEIIITISVGYLLAIVDKIHIYMQLK